MPIKILLITPKFYGIEIKIKSILEESGFEVHFIENRILRFNYHSRRSKFRFFRIIYFFLFSPQVKYLKNELKKLDNLKFDVLFAINAFIICPYLFKTLRKANSDLYSILYLWDSLSLYDWKREIKYFDRVLTFDHHDAKKYNIEYKPNFYLKNNELLKRPDEKFDIFFVGKFNRVRFNIIQEIITKMNLSGIKYYIKLWPAYKIFPHNRFVYMFLKKSKFRSNWVKDYLLNYEVIEGIVKNDFVTSTSIDYTEIQNILQNSNVILDLPFNGQNGYSHRLIEALANGKKVLTTNKNLFAESFCNPEQVVLLDSHAPLIDCTWIRDRSTFSSDDSFKELEFAVWLKSFVNVESV